MIDHMSVGVSDLGRAREFYDPVLAALALARMSDVEVPGAGLVAHGYGTGSGIPGFWIGVPDRLDADANRNGGAHVCFKAASRAAVDAFHQAVLKAGGTDNGAPGLRPQYHADYYGAFAFDPDGNKIEACCHQPGLQP
jgi:catechol 2,3-dioxygenase-like lactoylglutathione lyase family enzyme